METQKTHIYCMPGLAASSQIFEYLKLPEDRFEVHFLDWLLPTSVNEPLEDYAKRMAELVTEKDPILIGVSFGGIVVQEMSKFLSIKQIILISSIKSNKELPNRLKLIKTTQLYKLFPSKSVSNIEAYSMYAFGDFAKKRVELYKKYLSVRDDTYLDWAVKNVLNWKQEKALENIIHIQGTEDHVFPIKHIKNCIPVEKGTHAMIIFKAKSIHNIICEKLSC